MSGRAGQILAFVALVLAAPQAATAQTAPPAAQPAAPVTTPAPSGQSRMWIVVGATSTTLRGDCQEDCEAHGTGAYLHTGSLFGIVGGRLNRHMDVGLEVSWVPAETQAGEDVRTTFLLAAAEYKPWAGQGFFVRGSVGMAFVRNFAFGDSGVLPPVTGKGLGLGYGAGWTFRHSKRVGLQLVGAQHLATLGAFTTGGVTSENVIGNYWSVGAAIVIR